MEEFQTYVDELNDYKWRLTDEQKVFLELALELSTRLEKDAAFIETNNAVFKEKMDRLHDDQDKISPDLDVAKKYKSEIEDLQADTVAAAYVVA
ncbi:hypothetical protein P8452_42118 [Trifolium repens]|nr:hypothetical protein QL285_026404 [Trifolium repens]WJX56458.1 hypothetical protein P8452_42118 [Trifolium repens]